MAERGNGRFLQWAATTRRRNRLAGSMLRVAAPVLPRKPPPRDPIFVLGSPRSGTTMLVTLLDRSPRLASLQRGSRFLWEMFHTIESSGWESHALGPQAITDRERRVLYWAIDSISGGRRYLDKFPRNCLRAEYLHAIFPNAYFVAIYRDGRAAVSSLITGWRTAEKFGQGTRLPVPLSIDGYDGEIWKFLVPPGWREFAAGRSIAEVCAFQWSQANEAILSAKEAIRTDRWIDVRYEELVDAPLETSLQLLDALGLPPDEEVLSWAAEIDQHVSRTAVTAPRRDKWRQENPEAIAGIGSLISPTMRKLNYEMDRLTSEDETG